MFTGLIKEVGIVKSVKKGASLSTITVVAKEVCRDAREGDSVAVNGVCLTVTAKTNNILSFEAVKATLGTTSLKRLKTGSLVNLEGALKVGDKLGGHFVLGHVDCETKIKSIRKTQEVVELKVNYPLKFKGLIVDKGSIAVEGISLTVQKVFTGYASISIIPYTWTHTNLCKKRAGDYVNLEFDYLLKSKR